MQAAPLHKSSVGPWFLTRWADVMEVLRSERYSKIAPSGRQRDAVASQLMPNNLIRRDPPDHTRLRGSIRGMFAPRAVRKVQERAGVIARELLDECSANRAMDVLADFAYPLTTRLMCEIVGVPDDLYNLIIAASEAVAREHELG